VPEGGIEPPLPCGNRILSPARLPIPSLRRRRHNAPSLACAVNSLCAFPLESSSSSPSSWSSSSCFPPSLRLEFGPRFALAPLRLRRPEGVQGNPLWTPCPSWRRATREEIALQSFSLLVPLGAIVLAGAGFGSPKHLRTLRNVEPRWLLFCKPGPRPRWARKRLAPVSLQGFIASGARRGGPRERGVTQPSGGWRARRREDFEDRP